MSKSYLFLVIITIFLFACRKNDFISVNEETIACQLQTENPTGRSYSSSNIVSYNCSQKLCGILPLNEKNYWVYDDSLFTDGVFTSRQLDTLRFTSFAKTVDDGLIWWQPSLSVGLPDILYASDSSFFGLNDRLLNPNIKDVKKDYGLFAGDSLRWLASFEDNAAMGRSIRLNYTVTTPAGNFDQCIFFEKDARNFRRDQLIFRPGIGVIKYRREKSPFGQSGC